MSYSVAFIYQTIDKMTPQLKKMLKVNKDLAKQYKRNLSLLNTTKSRLNNVGKAGKNAFDEIKKGASESAEELKKVKDKAEEVKKSLGKTLSGIGGKFKQVGQKTKIASVIATASLIGMVAAFSSFEKGTENVFTLMDSGQVEKFGRKIKSLEKGAIGLGFSIQDATKAMFDNVSGLGAGETALAGYKSALVLAKAGNTDLTSATKGVISVINAYDLAATEATAVSSALFTAQKIGVTTVEEMSGAIGRLAPIAKAAGLSYTEMATSLAVMTKGGLSTEESATAMRATLNGLINPSKQAAKQLHKLGIPMGITAIKGAGIVKTMRALKKAIKEDEDVVVKLIPNIRALTGVLSLSEKNLNLMDTAVKKANKDTANATQLNSAYARMMNTLSADIGKAKGSIVLMAIELGSKLKPIVIKVMRAITSLIDKFMSMPNWVQNATLVLIAFTAALSPMATGAGVLFTAIGGLIQFIAFVSKLSIVVKAVTAIQWLWNIAVTANPIGAIVVAVIAAIAAIAGLSYWIWNNYDAINNWFDQFGIVGTVIKWLVGGPIFWLIAGIKEATKWMKKLGLISDDTVAKTKKFADLKKGLDGKGEFEIKQQQKHMVEALSPSKIQTINRSRLDGMIEIKDKGSNVQKTQSNFTGFGGLGMTAAGGA